MNNNNYINNLQQLLAMGNNPQQIIQNAIARNPQLQQVFSQIGGNGMTAKAMVMQLAQQQGIDVNQMIQFLQSKGIKM
jgi:hypothetical protein